MRKIGLLAVLLTLSCTLAGCETKEVEGSSGVDSNSQISTSVPEPKPSSPSSSSIDDQGSDGGSDSGADKAPEPSLADSVQDGVILHAWNWSMNEIKDRLPEIAEAGFTTIQTSPMQPQKDYYPGDSWENGWWKLYQPLGFSIATRDNALGTRNDLKELCEAADDYGIKVIVDVVTNHLAGGNAEQLNSNVQQYEPEIYQQNLIHRGVGNVDDNDVHRLVQGHLGDYPDLQTENKTVQNRVVSMLKDYVDCGVDGFRFDAAKHIETSHDGQWASDYWDNVIGTARDYAEDKYDKDLFIYGEILNTPGNGRDPKWYTENIAITDTNASWNILRDVQNSSANSIGKQNILQYQIDPEDAVLWAESHDTYANDSKETTYIDQNIIDRAYAIAASHTDSTALYFARPQSNSKLGSCTATDWESPAIAAVNFFHNRFTENPTTVSYGSGVYSAVGRDSFGEGALLVRISSGNQFTTSIDGLEDGTYLDQVSGTEFSVSGGKVQGTFDSSGIAVLSQEGEISVKPKISVSEESGSTLSDGTEITVTATGCDSASWSINGGSEHSFDGTTTIVLNKDQYSDSIELRITYSKDEETYTETFTYTIIDTDPDWVTVYNIPSQYIEGRKLWAWVWGGSNNQFVDGVLTGNTFSFDPDRIGTMFNLCSFPESVEIPDWAYDPLQTENLSAEPGSSYDGSVVVWHQ